MSVRRPARCSSAADPATGPDAVPPGPEQALDGAIDAARKLDQAARKEALRRTVTVIRICRNGRTAGGKATETTDMINGSTRDGMRS